MREISKWITIGGRHIPIFKGAGAKRAMANKRYNDTQYEYIDDEDYDEAYDKYIEMSDICYERLNDFERKHIREHYIKQEESYEINEKLRNGVQLDGHQAVTVDALDRACLSYKTQKDMASIRFVDLNYIKNVYGVEVNKDNKLASVKDLQKFVGTELQSKSFTSVSLNRNGNGMFNNLAVHMKINIPKGTNIYVADNPGEYEAILGRKTKLQLKKVDFKYSDIKGMEKEYGKLLLTYEVVK